MTSVRSRRGFLTAAGSAAGVSLAGCTSLVGVTGETEFEEDLDPPGILLTWQDDPTTTMTIDWHTPIDEETEESYSAELEYRTEESDDWTRVSGSTFQVEHEDPSTTYDRDIHRVELTDLSPDTRYEFRVGVAPIWAFETMATELDDSLTFASGGDTGHLGWDPTLEALMNYDPAFLVIAGDLPYADGGRAAGPGRKWEGWFDSVKEYLVDDTGRVVPIVAGIGNHECRNEYYDEASVQPYEDTDEWREWFAPYFYTFFAFPGHPGYNVLDFGEYLSIPMLDTNHTSPIEGDQTDWLGTILEERDDFTHIMPHYHVPAWPSHRELERHQPPMREGWLPKFEDAGVRFAFEHHDHTFKNTPRLLDGEPHEDGIIYIGDGCLGQPPRTIHPDREWIELAERSKVANIVTIEPDESEVVAIDPDDNVLFSERQDL